MTSQKVWLSKAGKARLQLGCQQTTANSNKVCNKLPKWRCVVQCAASHAAAAKCYWLLGYILTVHAASSDNLGTSDKKKLSGGAVSSV